MTHPLPAVPPLSELIPHATTCVLFLALLALLRRLLRTVRNRLFYDIHKIPSPPLPAWQAFTVGHNYFRLVLRDDSIQAAAQFNAWSHRHGSFLRLNTFLGAQSLVLTSVDAIRAILTTKHRDYFKSEQTRRTLATLVGENGLMLAERDAHARLRKATAPALHHDALVAVEKTFLREGALLADRLAASQASGRMDILQDVRTATFHVIMESAFGENTISPEEVARLHDAFLTAFVEPPAHALRRVILQDVFSFLPPRLFGWREDLRTYIRDAVRRIIDDAKAHAKAHGQATPLISLMIDEETNRVLPKRDLVDTMLSFLAAGQATTSIAVCWTLYLLAKHPEWQDRIMTELREKWTLEDGLSALDQLPLLSHVVRECLRLYPPIFYVSRTLQEDDTIEGLRLPAGSVVRIPVLAMLRDESTWGEDAGDFNPDRFAKPGEISRTKFHWLPFLYGPRGCIGQRFAILEIKAFIAQVLTEHRVYVKPLEDPPAKCSGPFASPEDMKVYFEARSLK